MLPFADPTDPPPGRLPPSLLAGRLDQIRDWFAATPVAIQLKNGIVISTKESEAPQTPAP